LSLEIGKESVIRELSRREKKGVDELLTFLREKGVLCRGEEMEERKVEGRCL